MDDREVIHERMLKIINDKYDKTRGSFLYDATKPAAIEFEIKNDEILEVKAKLDVENLFIDELERFINQRTGITRKLATKSTTIVVISGQEGSRIRIGDLVSSETVNFLSLENKIIGPSGLINVFVECNEFGNIGNVPVGAINRFPITIPGLISVINEETVANGYEAESDTELRNRYYERIRTPATSGNKYHYLNWAKEVVGVGDARVISLWEGDNTVKVIIIDSNKQPASVDLINKVQEHIDPNISGLGEGQAPIGAFCTVISAIEKLIDISVTITKDSSYSIEQIKTSIEYEITNYLKSIAFRKNLISYAQIGAMILDVEGVLDYSALTINLGIENIIITNEEVGVLGEVIANEPIA